jgi:hypothetical protein
MIRAPAPSTVVSAWESSFKLVSKGILVNILDIFKSGLVKRTVCNKAIRLDSLMNSVEVKSRSHVGAGAYQVQCVVFFS